MILKIFSLIFLLTGCQFFELGNKSKALFYVATTCTQSQSDKCIVIDGEKINSEPILILKVVNAKVSEHNQLILEINDESQKQYIKLANDYKNRPAIFFTKEKKLAINFFDPENSTHFSFDTSSASTLCKQWKNCALAAVKSEDIDPSRFKKFERIKENYLWKTRTATVKVYESKSAKKFKEMNLKKFSLIQIYNAKEQRFVYQGELLAFHHGWINKNDLYPVEIQKGFDYNYNKLKEYMKAKKCLSNASNIQSIDAVIQSSRINMFFHDAKMAKKKISDLELLINSINC